MASSSRVRRKATKILLGDMDVQVDIKRRDLKAPLDVKYGLNLNDISLNVWCFWEQAGAGVDLFDGVNNSVGTATDFFKMYYDKDIKAHDYVCVEGKLYEVLRVAGGDQRAKDFMTLMCCEKGQATKKVNML